VKILLEVRGLTVELPTAAGWVRPVNEVSLNIAAGESLGLVGESGSGKTMLSLALMGLLPPGARVRGEASLASTATQRHTLTACRHPGTTTCLNGSFCKFLFLLQTFNFQLSTPLPPR
jgi:ABC-type glutathione transport system ATPase component